MILLVNSFLVLQVRSPESHPMKITLIKTVILTCDPSSGKQGQENPVAHRTVSLSNSGASLVRQV